MSVRDSAGFVSFGEAASDGQRVFSLHSCGDAAAVFFGDGGGDGQTDAEAALLFLAAGGIGAVKPVKQATALVLGQGGGHVVGYRQDDVSSFGFGSDSYCPVFRRLFHGIVAQDGNQPLDGGPVANHP